MPYSGDTAQEHVDGSGGIVGLVVGQDVGHVFSMLPLGIAGIISWAIWFYRRTLSHRAPAIWTAYRATTSLVVPSYREDPGILSECLDTWLAERPDEIILVVDVDDQDVLAMLEARDLPDHVRVIPFKHRGKRSALGVGIRAARHDLVILSDSDTAWTEGLLANLQMPFDDPWVAGVGTRQIVAARDSSVWRRVASWMVDVRFLDYVPAMGARGSVPCLSGRTAAYRRSVITPLLPQLEHEIFLGRECVAGDDGRLTWLVLSQGYRTTYQRSAVAVSMFPDNLRAFTKQRVRWSRNSYRCYLTAIAKGWLWHQPFVTQLTVLQILLTPVTMGLAMAFLLLAFGSGHPSMVAALLLWLIIGRGIRGLSHLREQPRDISIVLLVTLVTIAIALPVKTWALLTMNRQGWLTRHAEQTGGEGQDSQSLGTYGVLA
jgi:cellulose synthase/poly-beta-1,6-N-acetylglucosamine synthase-like glycosyltransferase